VEDNDNSQYFLSSNASDDLPPNHPNTRWVVSAENTRFHHAGPQPTASLNKRLDLKKLMKASIHQCLICYKFKAQATQQLMGS